MNEAKRFGIYSAYGVDINKPQVKPKEGKLIYTYCGKTQVLCTGNFALLNHKKKEYTQRGYKKEHLTISY